MMRLRTPLVIALTLLIGAGASHAEAAAFVSDSFTGLSGTTLTSHVGEIGATWTHHSVTPGTAEIDSTGAVRSTYGGNLDYYASGQPATADYDLEWDIRVNSIPSTTLFIVAPFARLNLSTGAHYEVWYDETGLWSLYRYSAIDTGTVIATWQGSIAAGATYHAKFSLRGAALTVYIDGTQRISVSDSVIPGAGRVGFEMYNNATDGSGIVLDNIIATDAPSAPAPTPTTTFAVDNPALYWSVDTVFVNGSSYALMLTPGSYLKTNFSGTSIAVRIDTSVLQAAGVSDAHMPMVRYQIDGGAWTSTQLTSAMTSIGASGLASGTHSLRFEYVSSYSPPNSSATDKWLMPVGAIKVSGLSVDMGSTISSPTILPARIRADGDSITEGLRAIDASDAVSGNSGVVTYSYLLAGLLNAELSQVGYGSQGWLTGWQGNIAPYPNTVDYYFNGQPRVMTSPPDYSLINFATNDGGDITSAVQTRLEQARAEAGAATQIFIMVPFNGTHRAQIAAAYNAYITANPSDSKTHLIDLGTISYATTDGTHPSVIGHQTLAALLKAAIVPFTIVPPAPVVDPTPVVVPPVSSGGGGGGGFTISSPVPTPVAVVATTTSRTPALVPAATPIFVFTKNLTLGTTNADVVQLQKYLNAHGFAVAKFGIGSPGHEATYFGQLTYTAVKRFQEAHAASILAPSGLTKGSGYFGPSTRAFINSSK